VRRGNSWIGNYRKYSGVGWQIDSAALLAKST
jgi:hypothetical protein